MLAAHPYSTGFMYVIILVPFYYMHRTPPPLPAMCTLAVQVAWCLPFLNGVWVAWVPPLQCVQHRNPGSTHTAWASRPAASTPKSGSRKKKQESRGTQTSQLLWQKQWWGGYVGQEAHGLNANSFGATSWTVLTHCIHALKDYNLPNTGWSCFGEVGPAKERVYIVLLYVQMAFIISSSRSIILAVIINEIDYSLFTQMHKGEKGRREKKEYNYLSCFAQDPRGLRNRLFL